MKNKKAPYQCPCCGYTTPLKGNMRTHLYKSKNPCPQTQNILQLTDEVKEHILTNRVYIIPNQNKIINQTINNYNYMQNYVSSMDVLEKLTKYAEHHKIELINFEDKINETYMLTSKKLNEDKFKYGYQLNTEDFMNIVDNISSILDNKMEYFNIVYDGQVNKLKLYDRGTWKSLLIEQGVRQILLITKDYFLDAYEGFLMRKIKKYQQSTIDVQKSKQLLMDYYSFIGCFDIDPISKEQSDGEILGDDELNDKFEYSDEFYPYYSKALDKLTKADSIKLKKDIIDIVKRNTHQNIHELNKKVLGLIHVDDEFKQNFMKLY